MPHHVSKKHPQMSIEARAGQFAPFSALTGFDEEIKETIINISDVTDIAVILEKKAEKKARHYNINRDNTSFITIKVK